MIKKNSALISESKAKEVVLEFIKALNEEDFTRARRYASNSISFQGVMGSRDGADAYFSDMEKMKLKYDVQKTLVDGNDVAVFYNITMSGKQIFSSGWYQVEDGKISSFKVVFDPRPLLEEAGKN
ncbi:MAG TPA: nuclear transport factor 2 family protein [Chitinophagaceae bacterium]|nr:nuclear transport factor 2 family protein [Chitinophagaceae bacterium]